MKNKLFMLFSILLSLSSFVLTLVGASLNKGLSLISAFIFCIGIIMIVSCKLKSYRWHCEECSEEFDIALRENLFNIDLGLDYKKLYCPKCKTKTYCKGIKKSFEKAAV